MIRNYFTTALRVFSKAKTFAAINILGLSVGISASLVIFLIVQYHYSFDKFEKDGDRVFRVVSNFKFAEVPYYNSGVPDPMASAVRKNLTGFDAVIPFRTWDNDAKISVADPLSKDPAIFKHQKNIVFADNNLFKMLGYRWLAGSGETSLNQPYQVVLTESRAKLYFPKLTAHEIINKQIVLNDALTATVSGVVGDIKENTDFNFKIFLAYNTLESTSWKPESWEEWDNTNGAQQLYVKLSPGVSVSNAEKGIESLFKKNRIAHPGDNSKVWHTLQPLNDVHFNALYGGYDLAIANKPTLYGLLAVAAFLLILGCINFINLTTAHASKRAKEIGIRKTMGSSRKQLIVQCWCETFLLTFSATIISVALTPLILKAFSSFIPADLKFNLFAQPTIMLFLLGLTCAVTILAGLYPALVLSGYKPVLVLKNQAYANTGETRNAWLRKSLTVSQFVIAQIFIMATILVSKQISYVLNRDPGFKKDAIVYFSISDEDTVQSHKYVLMDKLKALPGVAMVSLGINPPSSESGWSSTMKYNDGKKEIETNVQQKYGDTNYIKLYGLKLLAGKNIAQTDTVTSLIINETYMRVLGFQEPQEAIGKYVGWNNTRFPVVGVVADFNHGSLHAPIKPLIIASRSSIERKISVALKPQTVDGGSWKTTISKIEAAYKEMYPETDFSLSFFDEDLGRYYEAEKNVSSLLKWATGLAVFISCLGLLGLVIYTTTLRTKEIGVRKVLGASVVQIVSMITKDFLLLIIIAFVLAAPLAWIGMNKWLENFAYRTEISWWIFGLGGLLMIIISLATLGFQTLRAAGANPVKSLRTE